MSLQKTQKVWRAKLGRILFCALIAAPGLRSLQACAPGETKKETSHKWWEGQKGRGKRLVLFSREEGGSTLS